MKSNKFSGLNYSLGNEDYQVDFALINDSLNHIMCVAASGAHIVPILSKKPLRLTLVDVSPQQLLLNELRYQTLRMLDYQDFLRFWGYPPYLECNLKKFRNNVFSSIKMSSIGAKFAIRNIVQGNEVHSPLYAGRWEQAVRKLSSMYRMIMGKRSLEIFNCTTLEEQKEFIESDFSLKRYELAISCAALIATLVGGVSKRHLPPDSKSKSFFKEYKRIFMGILNNTCVNENFFLQMVVLGKITHQKALPLEAQENIFNKAKTWVENCDIQFVHGDIITTAMNTESPIDYLGLSNVCSYFERELTNDYLQRVAPKLNTHATVFSRRFLSKEHEINIHEYLDASAIWQDVFARECTQIYSMMVHIKQ